MAGSLQAPGEEGQRLTRRSPHRLGPRHAEPSAEEPVRGAAAAVWAAMATGCSPVTPAGSRCSLVSCTCHPPPPACLQPLRPHTPVAGGGACLGSGLEARSSRSRPVALNPETFMGRDPGRRSMCGRAWASGLLWRGRRSAHMEMPAGDRCCAGGAARRPVPQPLRSAPQGGRGEAPDGPSSGAHNHAISTARGPGRGASSRPRRSSWEKAVHSRSR